jgi:Domain of unknown function (DUF2019)
MGNHKMSASVQLNELATPELVNRFAALARDRHDAMQETDVDRANNIHDEQTRICDELKSRGENERNALLALLDYPHVGVQCDAAGRCLGFAPDRAIPILEALVHSGHWNEAGGASFMLELYRSGKWKPT